MIKEHRRGRRTVIPTKPGSAVPLLLFRQITYVGELFSEVHYRKLGLSNGSLISGAMFAENYRATSMIILNHEGFSTSPAIYTSSSIRSASFLDQRWLRNPANTSNFAYEYPQFNLQEMKHMSILQTVPPLERNGASILDHTTMNGNMVCYSLAMTIQCQR